MSSSSLNEKLLNKRSKKSSGRRSDFRYFRTCFVQCIAPICNSRSDFAILTYVNFNIRLFFMKNCQIYEMFLLKKNSLQNCFSIPVAVIAVSSIDEDFLRDFRAPFWFSKSSVYLYRITISNVPCMCTDPR